MSNDNVTLNRLQGLEGDTIAADNISGVKHQRVKVQHGADGSATDVSTAAPLPVVDPVIDLALGNVTGTRFRYKFGYIQDLGTGVQLGNAATWVHCWSYGGIRTSPSSSFTPYMASSDNTDVTTITCEYLDADGYRQTVAKTLTGQTSVSLGVTATELFRAYNSGSTALAGTVEIAIADNFTTGEADTQNEVVCTVPVNDEQSEVLAERVQTGKQLVLLELRLAATRASGADGSIIGAFQVRESGGVWRTKVPLDVATRQVEIDMRGNVLAAGSDYRVQIRDVSDNDTNISGTLLYYEVDA